MKLVGNVHLVSGSESLIPAIFELLAESGMTTDNNPDVYTRVYTQFGIDEARDIRERASSRPLGDRRAFILAMPFMTHEAQNALLKVLEEPPSDAYIFLILPSPEALLPTLRSRTQTFTIEGSPQASSIDAAAFLKARPQARLDMLKPLLEKDDDERRDLSAVIMFLSSLERMIGAGKDRTGLDAIYRARRYLGDKGALVKPLLEQVALLVPVFKSV